MKQNLAALPDEVVNIPLFIKSTATDDSLPVKLEVTMPDGWRLVTKVELNVLRPEKQEFLVISVRIPNSCAVGNYNLTVRVKRSDSGETLAEGTSSIDVKEVENISLQLIDSPENIRAGETFKAHYLLKNLGNSEKTIFIETTNCDVDGDANVRLMPGQTAKISVVKNISEDLTVAKKEFITVRAVLAGDIKDRVFHPLFIFPVKSVKKDLFFRYPVDASVSYLSTNQNNKFESACQVEISGNGYLDKGSKHHLEFLLRGPNNANLSYMGLYDQYYVGYSNKNLEFTVGDQSYKFTPLTESSRYGFGVENRVILNNGISAGFIYVKPRFYKDIENEMAVYTGYEKDEYNKVALYAVQKKNTGIDNPAYLFSLNTALRPFEKTTIELEASRGYQGDVADNAYRANLNTQFSIFNIGGNYNYAGKNYPGYYNNSTFYSASFSAQLLPKINVGLYARQDFSNAQLDTFFVTAPYSRSFQYFVNYNIASQVYLKMYWRESERKDRLSAEKFHYETRSLNTLFSHKIKRFAYSLQGAYGKTTNFMQADVANKQNTYRISTNLNYRFSTKHSVRAFGTYSNLNSFVSGEQRDFTAGMAVNSQIFKKLKASIYLQNAYNIDDYYRNRNLMQAQLDYSFKKNHNLIIRAYNTLFKTETENSEFFISATYHQRLGVPLKQVVKAGDVSGRITNISGDPVEGIIVSFLNKSAITGENGEFRFRSVVPGVHFLNIDKSKLALDEMPGVPMPMQIEVIENEETNINIGITKGVKLTGEFVLKGAGSETLNPGNIVLELKSEFKVYRITANNKGEFSFPLVLPATWFFKIYENSLPKGFEVDKLLYQFDFKAGDNIDLPIEIRKKKRNIIFKSQNISALNKANVGLKTLSVSNKPKPESRKYENEIFYSIQIGSFSKRVEADSDFFKGHGFDIEKQIDNLYKYFIGRYTSFSEAIIERDKLKSQFRGAFVVKFKNNMPVGKIYK
uniref:NEW3 domain-containing protein n=1 Tax=uncultured Draconibacterium sp. TaxID=1573823 RepID=UPI0032166102